MTGFWESKMGLRRPLISLAVISLGMAFSDSANAQAVSDKSSNATAPLIWKTRDSFFSLNQAMGDSDVNIEVGFSFQPEDDVTKDLLKVDMSKGALIEASWGDGKTMTLKSLGTQQKEGFLRAEYWLKPGVKVFVDAGPLGTFTHFFDANALLNQGPGTNFQYHASNQANFEPWGWAGASFTIPGASIATSKLLSATFAQLGISTNTLEGNVAINMTTTPTFTYKTTSIQLGANPALGKEGEETQIAAVDTDYLELEAVVKGRIDYSGTMVIRPTVTVTTFAGFSLPVTIDLAGIADAQVNYGSDPNKTPGDLNGPLAVNFPKTVFHIPLPNVKVRSKTVDLGTANIGETLHKSVQIDNTGEMGASVEFESSDPHFKVAKSTQISTKGKYDLDIQFVPTDVGPAAAKVTVKSNDPNEPKVEIELTANGAKPYEPPVTHAAEPEPPKAVAMPGSDSGCGCVVVGQKQHTTTALGAAGLFGLGLVAAIRRRRRIGS
jgi:hypothetical protein